MKIKEKIVKAKEKVSDWFYENEEMIFNCSCVAAAIAGSIFGTACAIKCTSNGYELGYKNGRLAGIAEITEKVLNSDIKYESWSHLNGGGS